MTTQKKATPPPVASEVELLDSWDPRVLRALIERKSREGRSPAFLFLGKKEAALLRQHLAASFGDESVTSLKDLYYMGLEVIELEMESFLRTAGMKRLRSFQEREGRKPKKSDIYSGSLWSFDL
ncbi:MAG: hypothetical protein ACQKBY_07575 [Verrucomicrobiales bacterium]